MEKIKLLGGMGAAFFAIMMFIVPANAFVVTPGLPNGFDEGTIVELESNQIYKSNIDEITGFDENVAGSVVFQFQNLVAPDIGTFTTTTVNLSDGFRDLEVYWSDNNLANGTGLASAIVGGGTSLSTNFIVGTIRYLTLTWSGIDGGTNLDIRVAAVPVPPALLLFGTSLLGFGFLSRRRRRKTGMKMIAAA